MIKLFLKNATPEMERIVLYEFCAIFADSNGWVESTRAKEKRFLRQFK